MGYANEKGAVGEREAAEYYNSIFNSTEYSFQRIGGVEKNKKVFVGDVIILGEREKCVLNDYFLEVKKRGVINIFDVLKEAEDNAQMYGKKSSIVYADKQTKGKHDSRKAIVMSLKTFKSLMRELQGFRDEFEESRK